MRKILISVIVFTSLIGLAACNSDVLVKTDIGNITKQEFYDELEQQYGENVLQNMIIVKVLEDKYDVTENEIDERIDLLKEEFGDQFPMFLMQQGFDSEDSELFRSRIHNLVLQEKVQFEGIEISDEEIEERYNDMKDNRQIEIRASHILFDLDDEDTAKDVKKRLDEGEDFAELAEEYSEDTSAVNGGDLGYFKAGQMVPEFEDAAYSLQVGEISDLVESEHGIHIITVTDIPSVEDKKEEIRYTLMTERVDQTEVDKKIEQLLRDANIDIKAKDYDALKEYFKYEDPVDDHSQDENNSQENNDQDEDSEVDDDENSNDKGDTE